MKLKRKLPESLTTVTPFSKAIAVFIIFAFILAGVYVGMIYQHTVDMAAFSAYVVSQTTKSNGSGESIKVISLADNGKTLQVHLGDIVSFQLGNVSQRWTLSFSSPILKKVPLGIADRPGVEGRYVVIKEGKDSVTGTGVANCTTGTLCPMYAMHFSVTLISSK